MPHVQWLQLWTLLLTAACCTIQLIGFLSSELALALVYYGGTC
jgi:hypothetical protein